VAESGTYLYNPFVAELLDEAFEVAGVDPSAAGGSHIKSAIRSLRLLVNSEWLTYGIRNWNVSQQTHTTSVGEKTFTLPAGGLDIVEAVLRRGSPNSDVEMYAITRDEYLTIVNKDTQGRPDRYWVERLGDTKVVHYWQAGSNTTDVIVYNLFQNNQDVTSSLQNTLGLPVYAYAALAAGLAAKLALKYSPERFPNLQTIYAGPQWAENPANPGGLLGLLRMEDRERGDISTFPAFEPRIGRR